MMGWYTDRQLLGIPALDGLDADALAEATRAAGTIYRRVAAIPGVSDDELRRWAEGAGILPERFNQAVEILRHTRKLMSLTNEAAAMLTPEQAAAALGSAGDSVPTDKLTADELRAVAKRLKLDVPKSATKADLAEAIARA